MAAAAPSFTVGIEEEYLLVDRATRNVALEPPQEILERCQTIAGAGLVEPELLRSQIEVETRVCKTVAEARRDLARLRRVISEVAGGYGLAPIAASTHPFAEWHEQRKTHKARYDLLFRDMQSLARRLLICGMHVHVGIEDDELRVLLLNRFAGYLPLLLSLSTSSPFWQGEDTGLKSFRLTVVRQLPAQRTAGTVRGFRRLHAPHRHPETGGRAAGCHLHLVGPSHQRALPDARDPRRGHVHRAGGCREHRGAHAVAPALSVPQLSRPQARAGLFALPDRSEPLGGCRIWD